MAMDTTLRTKPLPTLPQRRQMIRERLAKEQAELEQFSRLAADANLSPRAAAEARRKVRTARWAVNQLTKALDYLASRIPSAPRRSGPSRGFRGGLRDRALLLLGFGGAFRRSELVNQKRFPARR